MYERVRRIAKPGSPLADIVTATAYDAACGMPVSETDARGAVTTYALLAGRCLYQSMTQAPVDDGTTASSALVAPVTQYTWNALGQLLSRTDPTGRQVRNAYNTQNYLSVVTVENGAADIVTSFARNSAGDIVSVTTTEFLYDGDRLVGEFAPGQLSAPLRRYVHGPGVDEPLIWYEGAGTSAGQNWLVADRQGGIIATTNASGIATTYAYDSYGIPREAR